MSLDTVDLLLQESEVWIRVSLDGVWYLFRCVIEDIDEGSAVCHSKEVVMGLDPVDSCRSLDIALAFDFLAVHKPICRLNINHLVWILNINRVP